MPRALEPTDGIPDPHENGRLFDRRRPELSDGCQFFASA